MSETTEESKADRPGACVDQSCLSWRHGWLKDGVWADCSGVEEKAHVLPVSPAPVDAILCQMLGHPFSSLIFHTLRSSYVGQVPVVTLPILVPCLNQGSATFSSGPQGLMCEDLYPFG